MPAKCIFLAAYLLMVWSSQAQGSGGASNQSPAKVTAIAGGTAHTLLVESDGTLRSTGDNNFGELGTASTLYASLGIVASNVTSVAAGQYHSLFIKSDGSLWGMGYNGDGELGDGTTSNAFAPEMIVASNVMSISGGGNYSLFVKRDGSLWGMGDGYNGQLGPAVTNDIHVPKMIIASNVVIASAGDQHTLFIQNGGSLWSMGGNGSGQLGNGTYNSTGNPQMIVPSNVTAIAAGYYHSLFLKNDGSLWGMGDDFYGELGNGVFASGLEGYNVPQEVVFSNVISIAAGGSHSSFIKNDGSLWTMGEDRYGELGNDYYANNLQPAGYNTPQEIESSNVTVSAAGIEHSLFIEGDGSLWAMGQASAGQIGAGGYIEINVPVEIVPFVSTMQFSANPSNGPAPLTVQFFGPFLDNHFYLVTNWNWNFGDGTGSTNEYPIHTYLTNGVYSVSLSGINDMGSNSSGTGPTIYVGPAPAILSQPQNIFVTNGASASFNVSTATPPLSYQWQFNGAALSYSSNIFGAETSYLTINPVSTNNGGSYTVLITNNYGSVTSSPAILTVLSRNAVTFQPQFQSVTVNGSTVQFTWTTIAAYPSVGYQLQLTTNLATGSWTNLGSVITGTNSQLTATNSTGNAPQAFYRLILVP